MAEADNMDAPGWRLFHTIGRQVTLRRIADRKAGKEEARVMIRCGREAFDAMRADMPKSMQMVAEWDKDGNGFWYEGVRFQADAVAFAPKAVLILFNEEAEIITSLYSD